MSKKKNKTEVKTDKLPEAGTAIDVDGNPMEPGTVIPGSVVATENAPDPDLAGHAEGLSEEQKRFIKKEKQAEREAESKKVTEAAAKKRAEEVAAHFIPFNARVKELKDKALTAGSIKRTLVDPIKAEVIAKGFKLDGSDPLNYQISW